MKRTLLLLILSTQSILATVIGGKITDLAGQTMSSNRTVVFTLNNCGNNIPRIVGSAVVSPASKTVVPNPAGLLTGTIVGNDIIECGTTIGQTFYTVAIFTGTQKTYEKQFFISGPTWNLSTAIPLSSDPTAFMNFSGYLLGDLIYGAGTNTLGLVRGNISATPKYLTQAGDGVHSGQPYWSDVHLNNIEIDSLSAGDYSAKITAGVYPGITAGHVTNGVYTSSSYPNPVWITSLDKGKVGLGLVENTALTTWTGSGNITAIGTLVSGTVPWGRLSAVPTSFNPANHASTHVTGAGDPLTGTFSVSITGNAATVTNGLYSSSTYTDPTWLTLTKAKVGLSAVENTALSTWPGSANIITLGTITAGVWHGTSIADSYIASAATWNAKMSPLGYTPENAANKGVANGYAGLNASGQIPASQLSANAGMTALVSDVAPQLGGNLDLNAKSIFGHLLFTPDNTYDIGASAASRPRHLYIAGTGTFGGYIQATGAGNGVADSMFFVNGLTLDSQYSSYARLGSGVKAVAGALQYNTALNNKVGTFAIEDGTFVFRAGTSTGANNAATLSTRWLIDANGHILAGSDITYDIGTNSGSKPRVIYGLNSAFGPSTTSTPSYPIVGQVTSNGAALQLVNYSTTTGAYAGLLMAVTQGPSLYSKGGMWFIRQSTNGRGDIVFSNSNVDDSSNTTPTDAVLTLKQGGNILIGGGHLQWNTDNAFDIGASGGNRPRNLYVAGAGIFGGAVTASQFNGSGAGLSTSTVPIASFVAGDYSSKITSGTYSINITGTAAAASIPVVSVSTATYSVTAVQNTMILGNAAANNVAITLFTAVGNAGTQVTVKRIDSSAFTLTLIGTSSQTMDGQSSIQIPRQYDSVTLVSNGTNWSII